MMGQRLNLETNHNVYVLGAGFSADAGMPVVKDFMPRMREALEWVSNQDREEERSSIQSVLEFRKEATSAAYRLRLDIDNIEHLFSLAAAVDPNRLQNSIVNSITATLDFCETNRSRPKINVWFERGFANNIERNIDNSVGSSGSYEKAEIDLYDFFAIVLSGYACKEKGQRNSVITFNYDLELEKSLRRIYSPFDYGLKGIRWDYDRPVVPYSDPLPIYKLHGSINWAYEGIRGKRLTVYENYHAAREKARYRLLIPPTWQKVFVGQLQSVWQGAVRALSTATRIVIIGFSLPETDVHFKYLLAAGLKDNITLREIIFINKENQDSMMTKINSLFQQSYIDNDQIHYIQGEVKQKGGEMLTLFNRRSTKMTMG
jgi:hypothetical protein